MLVGDIFHVHVGVELREVQKMVFRRLIPAKNAVRVSPPSLASLPRRPVHVLHFLTSENVVTPEPVELEDLRDQSLQIIHLDVKGCPTIPNFTLGSAFELFTPYT